MRGKQVTPLDLDLLHGLYARRIADEPLIALAQVVADKLGKQGLKLTKAELTEILDAIRANPLQFRLPPGRDGRLLNHAIEIDHIDIAVVEQAVINLEEEAPRIFEQMANDAASRVFRALKQDWPKRLRYEDDERARFKKHLYTKWKKPLDTMRHFLTISTELLAGYRERIDSDSTRQNLWELLTRLYARAIRTTEETYCLLSSGFSDGALSRWRTLHELAVVSHFMVIHGEEAATRYFDHQWVESKKRFDQLATPFWTSCIDAEFPRDRARVEAGYAAAIAKYGSPFRYDYGWAASGIGKDKPTFRDIEDAVDAGHYRAHYQWASSDIHAGSKGTYASAPYSLPMLVLGPTDSGLATAGEATLYVLVEMTEDVISLRPSLDAVATLKILRKLAEEAEKGFEKCKLKLEAKEKK